MTAAVPEVPSVGIREFRAALADYIDADTPVTVTRHGEAVGYFVPLRRATPEALQRVREAAARVQAELNLSEEEVEAAVTEFESLRRGRSKAGPRG